MQRKDRKSVSVSTPSPLLGCLEFLRKNAILHTNLEMKIQILGKKNGRFQKLANDEKSPIFV